MYNMPLLLSRSLKTENALAMILITTLKIHYNESLTKVTNLNQKSNKPTVTTLSTPP